MSKTSINVKTKYPRFDGRYVSGVTRRVRCTITGKRPDTRRLFSNMKIPHVLYNLSITPSDYRLFLFMQSTLSNSTSITRSNPKEPDFSFIFVAPNALLIIFINKKVFYLIQKKRNQGEFRATFLFRWRIFFVIFLSEQFLSQLNSITCSVGSFGCLVQINVHCILLCMLNSSASFWNTKSRIWNASTLESCVVFFPYNNKAKSILNIFEIVN